MIHCLLRLKFFILYIHRYLLHISVFQFSDYLCDENYASEELPDLKNRQNRQQFDDSLLDNLAEKSPTKNELHTTSEIQASKRPCKFTYIKYKIVNADSRAIKKIYSNTYLVIYRYRLF